MFVVDTNLLLYAVNLDSPEHERAHALVREWRSGERPWFLTGASCTNSCGWRHMAGFLPHR